VSNIHYTTKQTMYSILQLKLLMLVWMVVLAI